MPTSRITHGGPSVSVVFYAIARVVLFVLGWRLEGEMPRVKKAVFVGAPHTSAWDAVFMMAIAWSYRLRISFVAKREAVEGWLGPLMRWLGAVPVDRGAPQGQVAQLVERLNAADGMFLAISPEGTRQYTEYWKSGFYRIAEGASVPIVCGFADYDRKVVGIGPMVVPSGDMAKDMEIFRAFFRDIRGRHPNQFGVPRLREEVDAQAPEDASAISETRDFPSPPG